MKINSRFFLILAVLVCALALIAAAPFQTVTPPGGASQPAAPNLPLAVVIDGALVLAATSFVKERFGLQGKAVLWAAFGLVAAVFFYPYILAILPADISAFVSAVVTGLLLPFIGATGGYDFIMDISARVGKKINVQPVTPTPLPTYPS